MIVLAAFDADRVNTVADAEATLGIEAALIRRLVRDLEAAGLIEACALH